MAENMSAYSMIFSLLVDSNIFRYYQKYRRIRRILLWRNSTFKSKAPPCREHWGRVRFSLVLFVFVAQPVEEHLFDGLVVGHEHVADGVPANEMANLFSQVFGMVTCAFQ